MSGLTAVFGGTFDPVHYGHLRVALEAAVALDCADLRLVPAGTPPHRGGPQAGGEARAAMLELALQGQDRLDLDRRELERHGPSYSVDTLASLRREFPEQPLAFVLGEDAFAGLMDWYRWEELTALAHLVILARPAAPRRFEPPLESLLAERRADSLADLYAQPAGCLHRIKTTALGISSTRIRNLIAGGGSPRYLLPDPVLDYIRRHGLYRKGPAS